MNEPTHDTNGKPDQVRACRECGLTVAQSAQLTLYVQLIDILHEAQETAGKGQMNGQETWHLTPQVTAYLKQHLTP